jgi:conjugal transfer pilus assembly protein TrbC
MRRAAVAGSLLVAAGLCAAQGGLSASDRAAARAKEAEVRSQLRMPSDQELRQAAGGIRLPAAATAPQSVDVRALADKYQQIKPGAQAVGQGAQAPLEGLVVFVSLGMPRESLRRLVADSQRYGATLLLRGLKDRSLTETAKAIHELQSDLGEKGAAWRIDPRLFERFKVQAVPAYVLLGTGSQVPGGCQADDCIGDLKFARIDGDVSLDHALRSIATSVPSMRAQADSLIEGARR